MTLDLASLMTVASIVAGFGVAVLVFRIQREAGLKVHWLPWADRLLIAATSVALGVVILPIISFAQPPSSIVKNRISRSLVCDHFSDRLPICDPCPLPADRIQGGRTRTAL